MLKQLATTSLVLLSVSSPSTNASLSERQIAIDRCTAIAAMLASAYTAHPDDVRLRTDRIIREKKPIQDRLGATDFHLAGAYGAMAFYDGKRTSGTIPKGDPIDSLHIAAEGAARCMAATYDRGAL